MHNAYLQEKELINEQLTELTSYKDKDYQKVTFAVKLSLCALRDSKISVPVKCQNLNNNNVEDCLIELRTNSNFYFTYMGFYLKAVTMCFSTRQFVREDIVSDFNKNITTSYIKMMENLKSMVVSLRNKELKRLPLIYESLKKLANDIEKLKITSVKVSKEMNLFDNTIFKFKNDIGNAMAHTMKLNNNIQNIIPYIDLIFEGVDNNMKTHLSLINDMFSKTKILSSKSIEKIELINENLSNLEVITSDTLKKHNELQNSMENTTSDIRNFLNITKNEIKEFTTFTKLEIFEVANTFSSIINMAYLLNERMLL
ncbi:unnamed protein product [Rhizophagus irregularis]|nr:unnamed protein product [Rhizophagus irregularis]